MTPMEDEVSGVIDIVNRQNVHTQDDRKLSIERLNLIYIPLYEVFFLLEKDVL